MFEPYSQMRHPLHRGPSTSATPPYPTFDRFEHVLNRLQRTPAPTMEEVLEEVGYGSFSRQSLAKALVGLGLVDVNNHKANHFLLQRRRGNAHDWYRALAERAYPTEMTLISNDVSREGLIDHFRTTYQFSAETATKAVRFFLRVLTEADIPKPIAAKSSPHGGDRSTKKSPNVKLITSTDSRVGGRRRALETDRKLAALLVGYVEQAGNKSDFEAVKHLVAGYLKLMRDIDTS